MILRSLFTVSALIGLTLAAFAADSSGTNEPAARAPARIRRHIARTVSPECCVVYRYVYAEAWYGSEKIVAPVRRTPFGDEVQVPGGTWIHCTFSCEYTVRKLHLYYWQDQGAGYVNGLNPEAPRNDFWKDDRGNRHDYLF